jgi:TATA-box binding protein (TBP) (component of TFIID and TFIIIB)
VTIIYIYESIVNLFKCGLYNKRVMTFTKPVIEIVNVVASASIDQKLDLNKIQEKFPDGSK